jgi:hypothetical protein
VCQVEIYLYQIATGEATNVYAKQKLSYPLETIDKVLRFESSLLGYFPSAQKFISLLS